MKIPEHLLSGLPDPDSAKRFAEQFAERHPAVANRIFNDLGLLADLLALASFSPWAASTLLRYPDYAVWLKRHRTGEGIRGKDELLESLARFSLTNSTLDPSVLLSRFKHREYLRIFLNDLRGRTTIAETTEELSNLADAILEYAFRLARQEMENRFGPPMEKGRRGRLKIASATIVSLGKLGSRELNYASDIDLLFLYSADGNTSGSGNSGTVSNREFFIRLAGRVASIVGGQSLEGAAYRVDLRLRPYGRAGMLAVPVNDAIRYYSSEAADWERQVLIRSRSSAGENEVFNMFYSQVEPFIFSEARPVGAALESVRRAKEKINHEHSGMHGFNVKLGRGGIREIEFIAQALQTAYGGRDRWLRVPHTLIALQRLNDRGLLTENELSELSEAYKFLRKAEHLLQMEYGLQTHILPNDFQNKSRFAARMSLESVESLERELDRHSRNVSDIFNRIFGNTEARNAENPTISSQNSPDPQHPYVFQQSGSTDYGIESLRAISPRLAEAVSTHPELGKILSDLPLRPQKRDFHSILSEAVNKTKDYQEKLNALRTAWRPLIFEVLALDALGRISIEQSKQSQTEIAEASIAVAMELAVSEYKKRNSSQQAVVIPAILGLGKIGGAGLDFDSDLDLILTFDDQNPGLKTELKQIGEAASRTTEIFINLLSAFTRAGSLYRVDLRLRPFGSGGPLAISRKALGEYFENAAAIWELLAFVKVRGIYGPSHNEIEDELRKIVHTRAASTDRELLRSETRRIRLELQTQRSGRKANPDIKYGEGGMLDIYFAVRYIQLRDYLPDNDKNRSTADTLRRLYENGALSAAEFETFSKGYDFLSRLDHYLRVAVGRTTKLPFGNRALVERLAAKLGIGSAKELENRLALIRMEVRSAFDSVTSR